MMRHIKTFNWNLILPALLALAFMPVHGAQPYRISLDIDQVHEGSGPAQPDEKRESSSG